MAAPKLKVTSITLAARQTRCLLYQCTAIFIKFKCNTLLSI